MGCCNSKPKEKKPKVEPKATAERPKNPAPPKPPTPVQESAEDRALREEELARQAREDARAQRVSAIHEARGQPFRYNRCTVKGGDVRPLFEEGLVYRIVKDGVWYIYNDTLDYEAHVDYRFGPRSEITPGDRTSVETADDGWICAHAVVYPLETIEYISGTYHGYKSGVSAKAVSAEYLSEMARESKTVAEEELAAVKALAGDDCDEEVILGRCIQRNVPYVDINFPPTSKMLARPGVDVRVMTETGMQRPTQYLPHAMKRECDAVTGAVVPESIDPGLLGNCWLTCAASIMAEDEDTIRNGFANTRPKEREAGAYRVALSRHGWWRSVIVDNYLPTVHGMPIFARIVDDPRELWVSLMEKAYAKVCGSYATITGGDALQAVQDFTGAPTYRFDKEWEAATMNPDKIESFVERLVRHREAGYGVVVSTPSHTSTSYLGCKREGDPEAFAAKYASVGLRCGYTYVVEKVVSVDGVALFKVHNPWNAKGVWNGPWSAGSVEWNSNPRARKMCNPDDSAPGSFWISWDDAVNYFDGGGMVYTTAPSSVDYRVKGLFHDTVPSVVLEVTVTEPVDVMLVLSQEDKRGGASNEAGLRFAPCMLSVARHNGRKHVVEANSSWDPITRSAEYNFTVARDMAMAYHFEPSDQPYLVVPRIHRKGVVDSFDRPYVIGVISKEALDDKLAIRCTTIDAESRVYKNIVSFEVEDLPSVVAEHQVHRSGEMPEISVGEMIVGTAPPPTAAKPSPPSSSASGGAISQEDEEEAMEEPQDVAVTDDAGTPIHVAPAQPERDGRAMNSSEELDPPAATPLNDECAPEEGPAPADPIDNPRVRDSDDDSEDEL